jgi:hypothetical protein
MGENLHLHVHRSSHEIADLSIRRVQVRPNKIGVDISLTAANFFALRIRNRTGGCASGCTYAISMHALASFIARDGLWIEPGRPSIECRQHFSAALICPHDRRYYKRKGETRLAMAAGLHPLRFPNLVTYLCMYTLYMRRVWISPQGLAITLNQ